MPVSLQKIFQHPLGIVEKALGDLIMLGLAVVDLPDPALRKLHYVGTRQGHKYGRVGGNDELAVVES